MKKLLLSVMAVSVLAVSGLSFTSSTASAAKTTKYEVNAYPNGRHTGATYFNPHYLF